MMFAWMGLLSVLSIGFVVLPLKGSRRRVANVEDTTPAVLLDQLDEVKKDLGRGLISKAEAAAAEVEIKRRILKSARIAATRRAADGSSGRIGLWIAALLVPAVAIGYYALMGSPDISSLAYADRQAERAEQGRIEDLAERLRMRLNSDAGGGPTEGWMLLGQTYVRMGKLEQAVAAFETASMRDNATSATFSLLAEALINVENGVVTPKAEAAVDKAIALDPENPAGAFYKAIALEQKGSESDARALLIARLDAADGFAPWMESFVMRANSIGARLGVEPVALADYAPTKVQAGGPSAEDVAAASQMSAQDRAEFIRSMVERLAIRLENEPNDLDGWLRLANAYTVLGDEANARAALSQASQLADELGADDPRRDRVDQALKELD
jgi:cytochrome c-type biogenesis protein CcmH